MKKFSALLLAIVMMFSVCSCEIGKKNDPSDGLDPSPADGNKVVMETENFSVTLAEIDYIFLDTFNSMLYNYYASFGESYADYLSYYTGLDITKALKDQTMLDGSGTFFDYYINVAKEKASDILIFCEYATENGLALDNEDTKYIDDLISTYVSQAKENGCTLAELFTDTMNFITEDVIRSYSEKNILAGKGFDLLNKDYNFTDEEIDKEFSDNIKKYGYINYLTYSFKEDEKTGVTADGASEYANALSSVSSADEFIKYCENYHNEVLYKDAESKPAFAKKDLENTRVRSTEDVDYLKKLFDAKVGDAFTVEEEKDGKKVCNVYMLTVAPCEMPYNKVDVRHIYLNPSSYESNDDCRKAAEDILALYKQDPTEENFAALAEKYSEDKYTDDNGETKLTSEGGLLKAVDYNETAKDFENWIFDSARKAGDTDIVLSTAGYHIIYFSAFADEVRPGHSNAQNALLNARYLKDHNSLVDKYEIKEDDDGMSILNY